MQFADAPDGASADCDDGDNTTIDACASGDCTNTPKECPPSVCKLADGYNADGSCRVRQLSPRLLRVHLQAA